MCLTVLSLYVGKSVEEDGIYFCWVTEESALSSEVIGGVHLDRVVSEENHIFHAGE